MPSIKIPSRSVSTRASRSPSTRGRPNENDLNSWRDSRSPSGLLRPSQSVRSRSHDDRGRQDEASRQDGRTNNDRASREARRQRRRRDSSTSSASSIDAPRARQDARSNNTGRRRRDSPDSLSPKRPARTRHHSVGGRSPPPAQQGRQATGPGMLLKPDYVPGLKDEEKGRDKNQPGTPAKYKPTYFDEGDSRRQGSASESQRGSGHQKMAPDAKMTNPVAAAAPAPAPAPAPAAAPAAASMPNAAAVAAAAQKGPSGLASLMPNMPTALAAYAGFQYLSKNADKAKEWTDWFKDLQDAPEEMEDLADKAATAKDTIAQIQETIKARPDLLEDDAGKKLKGQIDDQIKSTDKALAKMNKMLADLSHEGKKEGKGDMAGGIEKYWNSYRYKDEWQDKIKAADKDLQTELASLSTLMATVYSRAIMKPGPPPPSGAQAVPATASAAVPATTPPAPSAPVASTVPGDVPANATAALSAAVTATPPPADTRAAVPPPQAPVPQVVAPQPVNPAAAPAVVAEPAAAAATSAPEVKRPPPSLVAAADGADPSAVVTPPPASASMSPRASVASAAVADIPTEPRRPVVVSPPGHRDSADISPLTSPPPRPSSVAKEEAELGSAPPVRPRASSAAMPAMGGIASAYMPTPPPTNPSTGGAPYDPRRSSVTQEDPRRRSSVAQEDPRKQSRGKDSVDSISSDLEPEDVLLDAAWDGDLDGVARALRRAPVNSIDVKGHTALHLACEKDRLAVAIMLLDRGADVHARADGGRMALHLASRFASPEMVEMLLERAKADPDCQDSEGRTPLHYAASAAKDGKEIRRDVLRVLRDFGADPTIPDRKKKLPRDVAQGRDHWDAAATLRRAEKKWDDDHKQNWLQRHNFLKK